MARRPGPPTYGKRFVGNRSPRHMEVHDLDNEKVMCQIDEIIRAGHTITFNPDTLAQAHRQGYDNCAYCIGGSVR
jgi:hypothetical protein